MASSMKALCDIIEQGLEENRRRSEMQVATYLAAGMTKDEAVRRVYFSHVTDERYRELVDRYKAAFGDAP